MVEFRVESLQVSVRRASGVIEFSRALHGCCNGFMELLPEFCGVPREFIRAASGATVNVGVSGSGFRV